MFFSPRLFTAEEAVALGLLADSVAPGDLDTAVEAQVAPYLAAAPGAVSAGKALLRALRPEVGDEAIETTIAALVARWESPEAEEGIAAFFERRPASWNAGPAQ